VDLERAGLHGPRRGKQQRDQPGELVNVTARAMAHLSRLPTDED